MPTLVNCPSCTGQLRVPEELAGKRVKCPLCEATFTAEAALAAAPPAPKTSEPAEDRPRDGPPKRRDYEPHRGTLILTLGIVSIVLSLGIVCYGIGGLPALALGIVAWVLGSRDLKKMKADEMDPEGYGSTQAGWICGIVGTVLGSLGMVCFMAVIGLAVGMAWTVRNMPPPPPPPVTAPVQPDQLPPGVAPQPELEPDPEENPNL